MKDHQSGETTSLLSNVINLEAGRHSNVMCPSRRWARAFQIIDEVAEQITASEIHAEETARRAEELITSAFQSLQAELARACAAEALRDAAEQRACHAEARLQESEEWLRKLRHALSVKLIEPVSLAAPPTILTTGLDQNQLR